VLVASWAVAASISPGTAAAAANVSVARSNVTHPLGGCSVTVSSFSFSSFSQLAHSGRFAQGYVSFNCASVVADIELSPGKSGQFRNRRMTATNDARAELCYNIYLDASRTQVFGDGTGGSSVYVPGSNVSKGGFPIYGEIADGQPNLPVATYSDATSITVDLAP
jgi:spore coat protein U-like protein